MSQSVSPPRRGIGRKNALDMVRSLAVIGAFVAVIVLLVPRPQTRVIPEGDIKAAAAESVKAGDVPVIVPEVPEGWKVTSARREPAADGLPAAWHLGYLTDDEEYVGLEATLVGSDAWLADVTLDGEDVATPVDIDGVDWATFVSPKQGRVSLTSGAVGGPMVVVTGSAPRDDLAAVAASAQAVGD